MKKAFLVALCLSLHSLSGWAATLKDAQDLYKAKNYAKAITIYDQLLKDKPQPEYMIGKAQSHMAQAMTYTQSTDIYEKETHLKQGIAILDSLIKTTPEHMEGRILRGQFLVALAPVAGELGAGAVDYWAYALEHVSPLYIKANKDLSYVITQSKNKAQIAEAYFYRSEAYEDDEEASAKDLAQSCVLGFAKACDHIKS